jgi:hypothetical protein
MSPDIFSTVPLPLVIGVLMLIGVIGAFIALKINESPYKATKYLFTKSERSFMEVLRQALPPELMIAPKVRVADVLHVGIQKKNKRYWRYFKKISSKHIDYILCRADNYEILAGVELDDASHDRKDRRERDKFLNDAFRDAGLPLIRIPARRSYDPDALSEQLKKVLVDDKQQGG